ncbi:glycoside hydrolase family 88 protein [Flavobacterium seoulense]|uniref:Glycoside hydrolase family protein n=1 Tax=Flavobacterium seoulense TaxID=1492738 RepID=A0A066WNR2_9FLAO|nr:glycoside hydrolase family 88 protein [Flavobacterium seoulense]KDN55672.1 glycoside hydrolase family protein [Flavobacterium seoulense]
MTKQKTIKNQLVINALSILFFGLTINNTNAQNTTSISDKKIASIFALETKYLNNTFKVVKTTGKMPRSSSKGFQPISDWTSGFYSGNLWFAYEFTKDKNILKKAEYTTALLEDNKYFTSDHDIGFLIYCSYGNGYRLTKNPKYKEVIIEAAKTAITRYNPTVKSIMSWNPQQERDWKFPVIIDNMINLELLIKGTEFSGDSTFYNIALNHANTTMKNQYRADFSCSHVVDYDPISGKMRKRDWNNGNSDPTTAAWSRGQSWGLYGFSFMYQYTQKKEYLDQAENIASYILNNPNMPADMVPYWDYNAPKFPTIKDASAAALLASGLLRLAPLSAKNGQKYFKAAEQILTSLSSDQYLNTSGKGYFLLKHATGNYLRESEIDGGLIYADYYFLEALLAYQQLKAKFV